MAGAIVPHAVDVNLTILHFHECEHRRGGLCGPQEQRRRLTNVALPEVPERKIHKRGERVGLAMGISGN
jgi:hypothetical protein